MNLLTKSKAFEDYVILAFECKPQKLKDDFSNDFQKHFSQIFLRILIFDNELRIIYKSLRLNKYRIFGRDSLTANELKNWAR